MPLITYTATRYRCPHCRKSYAGRSTAERHIGRCFRNPERRTCVTCVHRILDESLGCAKDEENWPCCVECGNGWAEYGDGSHGGYPTCDCNAGRANYLNVLCPSWEAKLSATTA